MKEHNDISIIIIHTVIIYHWEEMKIAPMCFKLGVRASLLNYCQV